jgi:hypothetical protein
MVAVYSALVGTVAAVLEACAVLLVDVLIVVEPAVLVLVGVVLEIVVVYVY